MPIDAGVQTIDVFALLIQIFGAVGAIILVAGGYLIIKGINHAKSTPITIELPPRSKRISTKFVHPYQPLGAGWTPSKTTVRGYSML